jgi:methyltransferase, FkbM family
MNLINKLDTRIKIYTCKKIRKTIEISSEIIGMRGHDGNTVYMEMFEHRESPYIIYSAGIGDQIYFELELLEKLKRKGISAELYAIDPTPASLAFLSGSSLPSNFHVVPYALSDHDGYLEFALPKAEGWVSGSAAKVKDDVRQLDFEHTITVEARTIKSIMQENGHEKVDLLKMDIEGSEFDIYKDVFGENSDITQVVCDCHDYMFANSREKIVPFTDMVNKNYYIFFSAKSPRSISCIAKKYMNKE